MIAIDKFCYISRLRYVNASEKFALAVITLLICIAGQSFVISAAVLAVMGVLTVRKGGLPFSRYRKMLMWPLGFHILSTLAIMINVSRVPLDLFAVPLGGWYITGSAAGALRTARLIVTALAGVSCLYFLSLSTPMTDILTVLGYCRCPRLIIELMLLIYRFIFVLLDIASAMTTAQNARLGNKDFRTACHSFGQMASALLLRALKKSNALYDAMEARCYDGTIRVLKEDYPPKAREIATIAVFEFILLILLAGRLTGWVM